MPSLADNWIQVPQDVIQQIYGLCFLGFFFVFNETLSTKRLHLML